MITLERIWGRQGGMGQLHMCLLPFDTENLRIHTNCYIQKPYNRPPETQRGKHTSDNPTHSLVSCKILNWEKLPASFLHTRRSSRASLFELGIFAPNPLLWVTEPISKQTCGLGHSWLRLSPLLLVERGCSLTLAFKHEFMSLTSLHWWLLYIDMHVNPVRSVVVGLAVVRIEHRTSCIRGRCSSIKPHRQPPRPFKLEMEHWDLLWGTGLNTLKCSRCLRFGGGQTWRFLNTLSPTLLDGSLKIPMA